METSPHDLTINGHTLFRQLVFLGKEKSFALPSVSHKLTVHPLCLNLPRNFEDLKGKEALPSPYTHGSKENVRASSSSGGGYSVSCCFDPLLSCHGRRRPCSPKIRVTHIWGCFLPSGSLASGILLTIGHLVSHILGSKLWPSPLLYC